MKKVQKQGLNLKFKCFKAGIEWVENNGVNLYQVLDRVSCYCCKNKNLQELKAMCEHLPEYWQKLKDMQAKTSMPFRDDLRIEDLEEYIIKMADLDYKIKSGKIDKNIGIELILLQLNN